MRRKQHGFTMIEILVTVAAVAILAAIAIPQYGEYVTRSSLVEAHAGLGSYRVLMEQYYQDNRNYGTGTTCGVAQPVYKNFTQTCTTDGQTYTATATGNAATRAVGFAYTINQQNVRATTAVPSGWTSQSTCFVMKKNGDC